MRIDVNGSLRLQIDAAWVELRPKERSVLAALVFHHPRAVDGDRLASVVWDDEPPATARKSVQNHIARIRQVAGDVIITSAEGYALAPLVTIDTFRPDDGEPFADLATTLDVRIERARIQAELDAAHDTKLEALVRSNDDAALPALRSATLTQPLNERRWWLFAAQLARRGQRRDALHAFTEARDHLAELGLVLGEQLINLERRLIDDDPTLFSDALFDDELRTARALGDMATEPHAQRPIHPHHNDPFVGREQELQQLQRMWSDVARSGQPHLMLVDGPSGSGKTRLVDAFVGELCGSDRDVRVMLGRSRHTLNRAYGVLAESFGPVALAEPNLVQRLGNRLAGLATVVPELGGTPRTPISDDSFQRAQLLQAVRVLLGEIGRTPTIWCVDDVQWASPDTIGVIEAAFDGLAGNVMIVATTRNATPEVAAGLAALQRTLPSRTIRLPPLSVDEVAELLGQPGAAATTAAARTVHSRTGGLALYASEIARAARIDRTTVEPGSVPVAIRDFVTNRLNALDPPLRATLELAAVIGERVDVDVLTAAGTIEEGVSAATTARRCDTLVVAGLLTPSNNSDDPSDVDELSFAHAITHEVVYAQLGFATSARLHRIVGRCLESLAEARGRRPDHAELAHHFERAGPAERERAALHARLAGHDDFAIGAWRSAAQHYARSSDLAVTDHARAEALVDQGRAELRAEQFHTATAALTAAIDIARLHGLAFVHADATLALVGRAGRGAALGADDDEQIRSLRAAVRRLDRLQPSSIDEARRQAITMSDLERELAFSLLLSDAAAERRALLDRSVGRMRNLSPTEPAALANALLGARYNKLEPSKLVERIDDIHEVLSMRFDELGHEVVLAANCYHIEDLLRAGSLAAAGDALTDAEFIADRFPTPYWRWAIRAWRGVYWMIQGDLTRAESTAGTARALRPGVPEAEACLGVNLVNIRLFQGRSGEVVPALRQSVERYPGVPLYRAVLALCLAESGDHHARFEARRVLDEFAVTGFEALPDDTNRSTGLAVLAHVACDLDDVGVADQLSQLLQPHADQWIVLSAYGGGGAVWGPASHALARLAAIAGDDATADRLFRTALSQTLDAPVLAGRIMRHRYAIAR